MSLASAPPIELRNVSRWYGEVIGISRVTLTLRPGVTGLVGPNGAGKSTIMNLVCGLIRPSQGAVLVNGGEVWGDSRLMSILGYCPQSDSFFERMTGVDFISSLLQVRGWMRSRARHAAIHALEQLGMAPNMNRRIHSYSKGMRQRTKVALAISHNPDLLVLDEPLDGLDAMGRHDMINLVRQFGREGRNVLISSHVLHEVESMTNNILMVNGGYLLAQGDVREVRDSLRQHPHSVYVRCSDPRGAARYFVEKPYVSSARIEDRESAVIVETRDLAQFHEDLLRLVLDHGADVSLVSVADESISSIFDYLARN